MSQVTFASPELALAFVVDLEEKIEQAYNAEQSLLIDEETDCFGALYRVWAGTRRIGTFYQCPNSGEFIAEAFYQNWKWANTPKKRFTREQDAIAFIEKSYRG